MKVNAEHYNRLSAIMRAGLTRIPSLQAYEARHESIPRIAMSTDPAKRHRWDALYAGLTDGNGIMGDIYAYADDSHIDTVLRDIVKRINK